MMESNHSFTFLFNVVFKEKLLDIWYVTGQYYTLVWKIIFECEIIKMGNIYILSKIQGFLSLKGNNQTSEYFYYLKLDLSDLWTSLAFAFMDPICFEIVITFIIKSKSNQFSISGFLVAEVDKIYSNLRLNNFIKQRHEAYLIFTNFDKH